jgi:hypothetical protein
MAGELQHPLFGIGAIAPQELIMKLRTSLLLATLLGAASLNAMACYTVYDSTNRVLYQGQTSPVDLSKPLHETLGRTHPGAHMVFEQDATCRPVGIAQMARATGPGAAPNTAVMGAGASMNTAVMGAGPARVATSTRRADAPSTAPLLTDRRTAMANKVPFTVLSGDVVMVPASYAGRLAAPSVTVVPAAAPSRVSSAAPQIVRQGAMITELRDPPMTIEQRGDQIAVIQN